MTSAQAATDATSTHSSVACAPAPDGPKTTVGMPAAEKDGRVHPGAVADHRRLVAEHRARVAANGRDDAGAGVDLERRPLEGRAHRGAAGQLAHLLLDQLPRLAGDRAPLDREQAAVGVARELAAALDERGVDRSRPEQRVRAAGRELLGEPVQAGEDAAHGGDRIDAQVGPRPVRGHARVSISSHRKPLCATQTSRPVGSVTMAASAHTRAAIASLPRLAYSSSHTPVTITSPRSPAPATRAAASMMAARPPFMS